MRYTTEVIRRLLEQNEGFRDRLFLRSRTKNEEIYYTIRGGQLHKRVYGENKETGERYKEVSVCEVQEIRQFLRKNEKDLNTEL